MKKLILPLLLIALINSIIAQKPFRSNYQIQDPRVPTNGNFEEKIKKDPKLKLANSTVQPLNMTNNPSSNWLISYGLQQNYGNTGWADRYQAFYEYDEYHNRTNRLIQQWNGFEWENDDNRVYSYDENNNLITEIFQSWESDLMEIGTLSQDMQAWGLDGNGGLIGIGDNNSTGNNELRSVNLSTAEVTTITDFNFDAWYWLNSIMVTDPDSGYVYAVSGSLRLYRFDMDEIIEWVWTNNTRNIYTYNEINNLITKINQYFDGTEWVNSGQDIYTYDESNNLITEIFQNYNTSDSTEWDNSSQTIYTYDESNNLITEIFQWWNNGWSNSSQTLYTYDENNNNTQLVWYYWNGSWNVWAFSGRIFYTWFDALLDIDIKSNVPKVYSLKQNYPNPFNPITTLRYELPENSHVIITIYDMLGRVVDTPVNQTQDAGFKSVIWKATNNNGNPVSAGIYLYQIQVGDYIETKKMVLLK